MAPSTRESTGNTFTAQDATVSPWPLVALWAAYCLLLVCTSFQDTLRNPSIHAWEPLLWEGSSCLVASGWMAIAFRARERYAAYLDRPVAWFGRYLRWMPLVIATFIPLVYAIRHAVYGFLGYRYQHPGWGFLAVYESLRLMLFAGLWLGILFGFDSYRQWLVQRHRLLHAQKALAEARLAHLQGQLRPHFLFNALNTVSALMHVDVHRADHLVATLGDLLRVSLRTPDQGMTPLAEELRILRLYADVMSERFHPRVTVQWEVDPALLEEPVPALLLQPLLENVFKHAVEPTTLPVHIGIDVRRESDTIALTVVNSGPSLAGADGAGTGLRVCRERLGILYSQRAVLTLSDATHGVSARIVLPIAKGLG